MNKKEMFESISEAASVWSILANIESGGRKIGPDCAIFLGYLMFLATKDSDLSRWIHTTQDEIQKRTTLTRHRQETARSKLRSLGFLDEVNKGIPCKKYYRINYAAINKALHNVNKTKERTPKNEIVDLEGKG